MATCALSGTLVDPAGTALTSVTVKVKVVTPCFDSNNSLVTPKEISVTSNASGLFLVTLTQSLSVTLTVHYPQNATDSSRPYAYSFVVPATATASFNSTLITEL